MMRDIIEVTAVWGVASSWEDQQAGRARSLNYRRFPCTSTLNLWGGKHAGLRGLQIHESFLWFFLSFFLVQVPAARVSGAVAHLHPDASAFQNLETCMLGVSSDNRLEYNRWVSTQAPATQCLKPNKECSSVASCSAPP